MSIENFNEKFNLRTENTESACEYCGKEGGHWGSCPAVTGNFGFDKKKENYVVETIRESGDLIKEYVNSYDEKLGGYVLGKMEFVDKNNNIIDISSLLPKDVYLVRDKDGYSNALFVSPFHFDLEKNIINYCNLKEKGKLFALFHEIGHAINRNRDEKSFIDPESIKENHIFKFLLIDSAAKKLSERERGAWAVALKMIRDFDKKGIVIEPELDYKKYLKKYLNSYYERLKTIKKSEFNKKTKRRFKVE